MTKRDFLAEADEVEKTLSESADLEQNSLIYNLMNKNIVYAEILNYSFIWSVKLKTRKVSLNDYVNKLGEEYNSVKNWIHRFSKTGLIKIYSSPRKYFTIVITDPENFQKEWLEYARLLLK